MVREQKLSLFQCLTSVPSRAVGLEEVQRKVIAECDALKQALLRKVFE